MVGNNLCDSPTPRHIWEATKMATAAIVAPWKTRWYTVLYDWCVCLCVCVSCGYLACLHSCLFMPVARRPLLLPHMPADIAPHRAQLKGHTSIWRSQQPFGDSPHSGQRKGCLHSLSVVQYAYTPQPGKWKKDRMKRETHGWGKKETKSCWKMWEGGKVTFTELSGSQSSSRTTSPVCWTTAAKLRWRRFQTAGDEKKHRRRSEATHGDGQGW